MARLVMIATVVAALAAAGPALAQRTFNNSIFGSSSLGCALDYTNSNETRMIVTNSSGQPVAVGSKLSWTTDASRGAFYLKRAIPAGEVFSFPLNAKGLNCMVKATPPQPMLSQ